MPLSYPSLEASEGEESWEDWFMEGTPRIEQYIVNELMPLIHKDYRTQTIPNGRAIAGLSMGGGQALQIGLANTDVFEWVGAISPAILGRCHPALLTDPAKLNRSLSLLWIGCGKDDFLYEIDTEFINDLKDRGIKHVTHLKEGGHTWSSWHSYLHEFFQFLFKQEN